MSKSMKSILIFKSLQKTFCWGIQTNAGTVNEKNDSNFFLSSQCFFWCCFSRRASEELDAVVTWNYKHLANIRKAELFFGVNLEQGFHKKVEIITPWEVIGYVES